MEQRTENILAAIAARSEQLGFTEFGIVKASNVDILEQKRYLNSLHKGFYADMNYLSRNIEKRFNPTLLVEETKSILVFLIPYGTESVPGVASYALGEDYHSIIKDKLHTLLLELPQIAGVFSNLSTEQRPHGRVFTDSAPVLERFWAVKAGLGFIGKNNFFISPRSGIKTLIGVIFTNIELPATPSAVEKKYCGNCSRCLEACPSGALCAPYTLDARKCISYHTIENKELARIAANELVSESADQEAGRVIIPSAETSTKRPPLLSGWHFGCDACLNACPWNSKNRPGWPEFSTRRELLARADASWWENLSESEFKDFFSSSPLLRGGLENIQAAHRLNKQVDSTKIKNAPATPKI